MLCNRWDVMEGREWQWQLARAGSGHPWYHYDGVAGSLLRAECKRVPPQTLSGHKSPLLCYWLKANSWVDKGIGGLNVRIHVWIDGCWVDWVPGGCMDNGLMDEGCSAEGKVSWLDLWMDGWMIGWMMKKWVKQSMNIRVMDCWLNQWTWFWLVGCTAGAFSS